MESIFVTFGWEGNEMEAFYFPKELAEKVLIAIKISGYQSNNIGSVLQYCQDTLNQEEKNYILAPFYGELMEEIDKIKKYTKKVVL